MVASRMSCLPFNLPDKHVPFRGINRARQLTGAYCGPATLQILLSHFGEEIHQEEIVRAASTKEYVMENGMSVELLGKAIANLFPRMKMWVKRNASLDDLYRLVHEYRFPVGANWQGEFEDDDYGEDEMEYRGPHGGSAGHYSVVTDVNPHENHVRIVDPYGRYAGIDRYFPIPEFLSRWWDESDDSDDGTGNIRYVYENRLMFVVLPVGLRFPEELGMEEVR